VLTRARVAHYASGPGSTGKIEKVRDPRRALVRLTPYLKPYHLSLISVFVFILASTVLGLIGPYLMGQAIDKFIAVKKIAGLATIAVWMLVVYVLGNLSDLASGWLMASDHFIREDEDLRSENALLGG
jgi:ATP-binding cassette subfamily B multidrug efflux pump